MDHFEREELPPLDMFEALFEARGWPCERQGEDEIVSEHKGSWTSYQLRAVWREEDAVLQLIVLPDIVAPKGQRGPLYEALGLINEQMWIGHFDMWSSNGVILFRHAATLGNNGTMGVEQAQTIIDAAIDECERFYPVFQFVLWGGKSPAEAIDAAMIDTFGEA